jgi:hypothetical protein
LCKFEKGFEFGEMFTEIVGDLCEEEEYLDILKCAYIFILHPFSNGLLHGVEGVTLRLPFLLANDCTVSFGLASSRDDVLLLEVRIPFDFLLLLGGAIDNLDDIAKLLLLSSVHAPDILIYFYRIAAFLYNEVKNSHQIY